MPEVEDEFPNDFDGFDFDSIPALQAPTTSGGTLGISLHSAIAQSIVLPAAASPVTSIRSNSIEDMDSSFLAAVDALEARALGKMPQDLVASGSLLLSDLGGHTNDARDAVLKAFESSRDGEANSLNRASDHPKQSTGLSSAAGKGKRKAGPQDDVDVGGILAGYETELICPICCDLLVGAQVANPCGHTCCGECGYGWLSQNKCEPTCAICRAKLSTRKPLLPNFSVDNLVLQHLQALRKSGRPDWQEKGYRTIEWNKRLESWKKTAAIKAAKGRSKGAAACPRWRYYEFEEYVPIDEDLHDSGEAPILRVLPRRGTRSRH